MFSYCRFLIEALMSSKKHKRLCPFESMKYDRGKSRRGGEFSKTFDQNGADALAPTVTTKIPALSRRSHLHWTKIRHLTSNFSKHFLLGTFVIQSGNSNLSALRVGSFVVYIYTKTF